MKFKDIKEAPKTAVLAFGRMNPPTIGHKKLADKVASLPGDSFIFVSQSQKPKTDPLSFADKLKYAKASFPNVTVGSSDVKTIIQALQKIESMGYDSIIYVAGSDRIEDFTKLINQYNGKEYNFNKIDVVSAGERDPDAEGAEGMSASKMRAAAAAGDFDSFKQGVANPKIAQQMFTDVRKGMGITEILGFVTKHPKRATTKKKPEKFEPSIQDKISARRKAAAKGDKDAWKSKTTNEAYKLQLERGKEMDVLHIVDTKTGNRTEVRGKPNYEIKTDLTDKLHQLLNKLGKAANFSELINGEVVTINPKHPDAAKAKAATDKAYNEKSYNNHVGHDDLLSMPKNTLVIDTPGDLDWYKIGQHFPTLNKADPREFGQGDSDMVITFASDKEKEVFLKLAARLGLKVKDIGGSVDHPEIHSESSQLDSLRKFVKSQREAPDQVLYQMMMAPDTYGHAASNFVRSWYERTKEENGLNDVDSALEIMVDELGLNENFADGKKNEGAEITMWTNPEYQGADVDDKYYKKQPVKIVDISKLTPFEPADKMDPKDNHDNMMRFVDKIKAGEKVKPIVIVPHEGKLLIVDGHHRYFAHKKAGVDKIRAVIADPKDLTWRDDVPESVKENFADGKKKGKSRPGRVKRAGASCNGSVTALRKRAKNSSGEKARMYHWCANMKGGKKK
jgi:hypothetical protein